MIQTHNLFNDRTIYLTTGDKRYLQKNSECVAHNRTAYIPDRTQVDFFYWSLVGFPRVV